MGRFDDAVCQSSRQTGRGLQQSWLPPRPRSLWSLCRLLVAVEETPTEGEGRKCVCVCERERERERESVIEGVRGEGRRREGVREECVWGKERESV